MNRFLKERRKSILIVSICGILGLLCIMGSVIHYANGEYRRTLTQAGKEISQISDRSGEAIEFYVESACSYIQNVSIGVSSVMTDSELENPQEILSSYIASAPFTNIEYIRADGMNLTNAGDPFDASEREYYKEGIQGNTGVWINFSPKYSDEPLLNFYTPLIWNDQIVGVLTGTIGGNSAMKDLLLTDYLGEAVYGIVVDENNTIIASTTDFEKGMVLDESTANVDEDYKNIFLEAIERADGNPVELGGKYNNTICVVHEVENMHWKIIQIAPSTSVQEVTNLGRNSAIREVELILIVSLIFFVIALCVTRKLARMNIHQVEDERDEQMRVILSMSDMYYSMHLVDLQKDTVREYRAGGELKAIVDRNVSAISAMKEVIEATISDEYLEAALEFTDLTTIADRMEGKIFTYQDMLGVNVGWTRFYFITLEKDLTEKPTKIIIATQVVDEEKRREQDLLQKSNYDELTGVMNRRAYEEKIQGLQEDTKKEKLIYVSMDVNGLKVINDTMGHVAGDELIRGAANCMKECFHPYGNVYRVGGDEFIAIMEADSQELEEVKKKFEILTGEWKGKLVDHLTISCGYVPWKECDNLSIIEVAKIADERMYHSKAMYYKEKGVDRRGLTSAQTKLLSLYKKILKINLTQDIHTVVSMDMMEKNEGMGYSEKISQWFKDFAMAGNVHEKYLNEYLEKTDLDYLRNHFDKSDKPIGVHYWRKDGDDFKPVVMEILKADDYTKENQCLFVYVREVDR